KMSIERAINKTESRQKRKKFIKAIKKLPDKTRYSRKKTHATFFNHSGCIGLNVEPFEGIGTAPLYYQQNKMVA
ncbi:hypothetical protein, partial [Methylocucumis oryzae]